MFAERSLDETRLTTKASRTEGDQNPACAGSESERSETAPDSDAAGGSDGSLKTEIASDRIENGERRADKVGDWSETPDRSDVSTRLSESLSAAEQPRSDFEMELEGYVGPYKIFEKLGEGGMGAVYRAEQRSPVRREVALKLIKQGMDTAAVIARFDAERQALAMMEHENIAKVLDAGSTPSGRPYFVMERVRGAAITEYCEREHLSLRERLELFTTVCRAIHHAHQKGIIHRDIKPSNVLAAKVDGRSTAKVIDFGLAKALDHSLNESGTLTRQGDVLGTLQYMSPEQAGLRQGLGGLDVDTRSDVYSLGVVLYELITGETPLATSSLADLGAAEFLRRVREHDPPKPSTRLALAPSRGSRQTATLPIEPIRLSKQVRGELDWIVMKALEKDRRRRYESASALAADIERYLHNDAVEACPPSRFYRLRKMAGRHRVLLSTSLAFVALLTAGAVGGTLEALRAGRAERLANQSLEEVEAAKEIAREEAKAFEDINEFLVQDLLLRSEPTLDANDYLTTRQALDDSSENLTDRFRNRPRIAAALHRTLGRTYHGLKDYVRAERHWRAVLEFEKARKGADSVEVYDATAHVGHLLHHLGRSDEAVELLAQSSAGLQRLSGPLRGNTLASLSSLANVYHDLGRHAEAAAILQSLIPVHKTIQGPTDRRVAEIESRLGLTLMHSGRFAEAEPMLREALAIQDVAAPDGWLAFEARSLLGECLVGLRRFDEAEPLLLEGYSGIKARENQLEADRLGRLREAAARIARLYDARGMPERGDPWRNRHGPHRERPPRRGARVE